MSQLAEDKPSGWIASVFHAEVVVAVSLDEAWEILLRYEVWNPEFVGATITSIAGERRCEGEIVLFKTKLPENAPEPFLEFFAETVKVIPRRRISWYVYPREGNAFRNFVDFALSPTADGVSFTICYYEQITRLDTPLPEHRRESELVYRQLAHTFKDYCEENTQRAADSTKTA